MFQGYKPFEGSLLWVLVFVIHASMDTILNKQKKFFILLIHYIREHVRKINKTCRFIFIRVKKRIHRNEPAWLNSIYSSHRPILFFCRSCNFPVFGHFFPPQYVHLYMENIFKIYIWRQFCRPIDPIFLADVCANQVFCVCRFLLCLIMT